MGPEVILNGFRDLHVYGFVTRIMQTASESLRDGMTVFRGYTRSRGIVPVLMTLQTLNQHIVTSGMIGLTEESLLMKPGNLHWSILFMQTVLDPGSSRQRWLPLQPMQKKHGHLPEMKLPPSGPNG
jgi:hypothetical protein